MTTEESIETGEVGARKGQGILLARAIGSCVAVTAFDSESRVGGMAHVMLPGTSPDGRSVGRTRYARGAVSEMVNKMAALGAEVNGVNVCLVGGANVLGDGHDSPGPMIVESLITILHGHGIVPVAKEVGGTQRRSCSLDVARGRVTYTVGDLGPHVLWEARDGCRVRMSSEMSADKSPTRQEG